MKKASIVLAVLGQIILAAGHLGYMSLTGASFALLSLGFGFAHFLTMEVDFKYKLGVRPAGLFPFVLGPLCAAGGVSAAVTARLCLFYASVVQVCTQ